MKRPEFKGASYQEISDYGTNYDMTLCEKEGERFSGSFVVRVKTS
jgi:hypothetical protein